MKKIRKGKEYFLRILFRRLVTSFLDASLFTAEVAEVENAGPANYTAFVYGNAFDIG